MSRELDKLYVAAVRFGVDPTTGLPLPPMGKKSGRAKSKAKRAKRRKEKGKRRR